MSETTPKPNQLISFTFFCPPESVARIKGIVREHKVNFNGELPVGSIYFSTGNPPQEGVIFEGLCTQSEYSNLTYTLFEYGNSPLVTQSSKTSPFLDMPSLIK